MATRSIVKQFAAHCRNFVRDSRGNISLLATLAAVPFIAAVGVGVDYGRVAMETSALGAAVDSALLAIISSDKSELDGLTDSEKSARLVELEDMAEDFLAANFNSDSSTAADIDASIVINDDTVTMTAIHAIPTSLMSFLGVENVNVTVVSEAKRNKKASVPIEIALVMDTTGSMGSTYMSQAKTAARTLMDTIYGGNKTDEPESSHIRVSLVPFAAAVRLNKAAYDFNLDWIDTTGASSVSRLNFSNAAWHNWTAWEALNIASTNGSKWNGCVEARARGSEPLDYNTNDAAPINGETRFVPYFAPDEPTFSNSDDYPYNFDNSYISTSGTPRETTGISSTISSPYPTTTQLTNRQKNYNKYVSKTITAESSSSKGPWYNCAKTSIVPMTYDRAKIEAGITAMTASGNTVIPEGLAWGWRTLSPTEPFTKVEAGPNQAATTISEYGADWKKVLVLMTDGENNVLSGGSQVNSLNGTLYSAYGFMHRYGTATLTNNRFGTTTATQSDDALDDATLALCENIKAEGITIYTVAFRVTAPTILDNLETCATSLDHYSYAADGTELAQVFEEIGESVTSVSVRLSK